MVKSDRVIGCQYLSLNPAEIESHLREQDSLVVNPRRKNGLIIYKEYHAEFAGPGAIVGGVFDTNVVKVVPVGNLTFTYPQTSKEKISAYLIRRQWIRLIKHITDNPEPLQRAKIILNQFEHWFDIQTAAQVPDQAFALLVGVLPQTINKVRNTSERLE
jgi:hypothetical protein